MGAGVGLVLGFLVGLILAWVTWRGSKKERELPGLREAEAERLTLEPAAVGARAGASGIGDSPDDLTVIEGVGPRFSGVLQDAGITTFGLLGAREPGEITAILHEEDPRLARLADPTTWPEQAVLAAAGAWDVLEELQKGLTGGRRTE
jgi:predicted flap endonuclease-1-like 5' DNA nuclease